MNYLIAASQHNGALKLFRRKATGRAVLIGPGDVSAFIRYKDGRIRKEEFYYGSSFLSQSARWLDLTGDVDSVVITDYKGRHRRE